MPTHVFTRSTSRMDLIMFNRYNAKRAAALTRHLLQPLAVAIIAALCAVLTAMPASAAPAATPKPAPATMHGRMQADCAHASPSALKIAISKGVCASPGKTLNAVNEGNCGTDNISLVPGPDANVTIYYGFDSSIGPVVYRDLSVGYAGGSFLGSFPDQSVMFGSSYSGSNTVFTGVGEAFATLGGTVTLVYGLQCDLVPASDSTLV